MFALQVNESEVDLDYVLYTDCDVLFEKDVNSCTVPPPPATIYVGGESQKDSIANTGKKELEGMGGGPNESMHHKLVCVLGALKGREGSETGSARRVW